MTEAELNAILAVRGWCDRGKAQWVYDTVRGLAQDTPGPLACVEIGVYGGRSFLPAALALRDHGSGHAVGVDPYMLESAVEGDPKDAEGWVREGELEKFHAFLTARILEWGLGHFCSLLRAPSQCCHQLFGPLDYLHVDGCHAEQVALRDVTLWVPKVRPGGVVVLDDVDWESLQPARAFVRERGREMLHGTTERWATRWEAFRV